MSQVEEYEPPPKPAKLTDSRSGGYVRRFGRSLWNLDALELAVLRDLIRDVIRRHMDEDLFRERSDEEARHWEFLGHVSRSWPELVEQLRST